MNIGTIIKNARLDKGYTQEELAEKIGVKKSAIAKWENGRVTEIKRTNLAMISKILDINPINLISLSEEIKKDPEEAAAKAADVLLNPEIVELNEVFMSLNPEKRKQALDYIKFLSSKN